MTATHTRTHVATTFADPYLTCDQCGKRAAGFHDPDQCGCEGDYYLVSCEHAAGVTSVCPSWSPVDGCICQRALGYVPHPPEPPSAS